MDKSLYNINRYNRKKEWFRIRLGVEQLFVYPVLNIIWLFLGMGIYILIVGFQKVIDYIAIPQILQFIFVICVKILIALITILCVLEILHLIGEVTAKKDEGDMALIFDDIKNMDYRMPILISKKRRKKKVTIREFYTTIPMRTWKDKMDKIADIMDIHFIGEIEYGGKNCGNKIIMKSGNGRKAVNNEVLYDDTF